MAAVVSQHVHHIGRHVGFSQKYLFYAKLQQILLKLVENMCLQPQIGKQSRIESKKEIRTNFLKNLQFYLSNFNLHN